MSNQTPHPRPQLAREGWTDLCGEWGFAFDDHDRGRAERWQDTRAGHDSDPFDRTIVTPYPPESALSGIADTGRHPLIWYRTSFAAPQLAAGERLLVHFGAVDYQASVWLNGQHLGDHEGGQSPFSFDVTDGLDADTAKRAEQVLVVRAEDHPGDPTQPRGKQDWRTEPHGVWYHRTTGIWQPVWLERAPQTHLVELHWTPDLAGARVRMQVRLNRRPARPVTVRARLALGEEVLAEQSLLVNGDTGDCDVAVAALAHGIDRGRLVWSPESPTLIDATVTVLDDGKVVDEVASYLGLRSAGYRDGRFLLNGDPYYLRLVLEQGFWPESHLAAPSADALRQEVELIKELGFNGARVHQKVEDPRFLYWCDKIGLLVWGEMANAYTYSTRAVERMVTEWLQVVRRDRSHPCVVTWVPLNESWGVRDIAVEAPQQHYASALYHLTKALDPSRPVISNDGWEHTESDIWGVHDYAPTGASLAERWSDPDQVERMLTGPGPGRKHVLLGEPSRRGQPVVLTEFGGLSHAPDIGEKWFGYGTVESADELLERFTELVGAILDSPEVAGFCYTQLTDTLQERNGLLDENRKPKLPVEAVREALTRPSRSIPAELVDAYRRAARRRVAGRR